MSRAGAIVLLACSVSSAAPQADLEREDLSAIQAVFRKADASLDRFRAMAKKAADATHAVMVVEAERSSGAPGKTTEVGVFVVAGEANQVRLVIDTFPGASMPGYPTLELIGAGSAYLHFYSEYGMYEGSIKYVYDLAGGKPVIKIRYQKLALTDSWRADGELNYAASFGGDRRAVIRITPGQGDSLPSYRMVEQGAIPEKGGGAAPVGGRADESAVVANTTPPGQPQQRSGINLVRGANKQFFPAPVPSMALYRKLAGDRQAPAEIENQIGPYVRAGQKIWFANTFYDGEGISGVGAIGEFDIASRKYEMHYLPEIAPWSGSAILLDGDELWIGLMRRPEGAEYGAGLLRYNIASGAVRTIAIGDLIHTLDRVGDALYCGSSNGLYVIRAGKMTQLRFEPDESGKLGVLAHEVR